VSSGQVEILRDVESNVRDRDILLIDDILESGRTLVFARTFWPRAARAGCLTAVLLEKPGKRASPSRPISSASSAPTCSWSATAWMWRIPIASYPSLELSPTTTLNPICLAAREAMARVLLVDDEEPIRAFLKRGLEVDGHVVTTASDGADGLDRLTAEKGAFDLLLTDIRMPMMDGIALALAAKRDFPDLTILLMTGFADQRERAKGLQSIVADVLTKPFSLAEMRSTVARVLASEGPAAAS
jgi:CheY-like chemotaxis protein